MSFYVAVGCFVFFKQGSLKGTKKKKQPTKKHNKLRMSNIKRTEQKQNSRAPVNKKLNLMLAALLSFHLHLNWMRRINSLEKKKKRIPITERVLPELPAAAASLQLWRPESQSALPRLTFLNHHHHHTSSPPRPPPPPPPSALSSPCLTRSLILPSLCTPPLSLIPLLLLNPPPLHP